VLIYEILASLISILQAQSRKLSNNDVCSQIEKGGKSSDAAFEPVVPECLDRSSGDGCRRISRGYGWLFK
jgi:hypothetical protein